MSNYIISFEVDAVHSLEFYNQVHRFIDSGRTPQKALEMAMSLYHIKDLSEIQQPKILRPEPMPPEKKPGGYIQKTHSFRFKPKSGLMVEAYIRKVPNGYKVLSKSGKNMGIFPSMKKAKKRLQQVEFFKHKAAEEIFLPAGTYEVAVMTPYGKYEVDGNVKTFYVDQRATVIQEDRGGKYVDIGGIVYRFKTPVQTEFDFGKPKGWLTISAEEKQDEELEMGIKVEQEHEGTIEKLLKEAAPDLTEDELQDLVKEATVSIAEDHLKEMPDYYSKLKVMEGSKDEKVKAGGAEEKSHEVNEPVRKENFNLFHTDMPDSNPGEVFQKGYDTTKPPDSGDNPQALFDK